MRRVHLTCLQAFEQLHRYKDALADLHRLINSPDLAPTATGKQAKAAAKQRKSFVQAATRVRNKLRALQHDKATIVKELLRQLEQLPESRAASDGSTPSAQTVLARLYARVQDAEFVPFFIEQGGVEAVWPRFRAVPAACGLLSHLCAHLATLKRVLAVVSLDGAAAVVVGEAAGRTSDGSTHCGVAPTNTATRRALDARCAALGLMSAMAGHMATFRLDGHDKACGQVLATAEACLADNLAPAKLALVALQAVVRCCHSESRAVAALQGTVARRVLGVTNRDEDEVVEAASLALARIFGSYVATEMLARDVLRLVKPILMSNEYVGVCAC